MTTIANKYSEQKNAAVSEGWTDATIYQPDEAEQILLAEQSSCLAVRAYLKMCNLKYDVKCVPNAEFMSRGGRYTKLPILRVGTFVESEFEPIINLVESKGFKLTDDLTAEEKSDLRAYMSLVENVFTSAELYMTWVDEDIYNKITHKRYGSVYPFPLNYIQNFRKRRQVYSLLNLYDYKDIPKNEVFEKIKRCCGILSDLLGNKKYFYGNKPTELDAIVFGHLFSIITTNLSAECPLDTIIKEYENLSTFCKHISEEYFRETSKKKLENFCNKKVKEKIGENRIKSIINDNIIISNNNNKAKKKLNYNQTNNTTVLMDNKEKSAPTSSTSTISKQTTNRSHLKRRNSIDKQSLVLDIEQELAYRLYILFELNFIINIQELRCIIKLYLDRRGMRIKHFLANMPTFDYIDNFLERNTFVKNKLMSVNNNLPSTMIQHLVTYSLFIDKNENKVIDESLLLDNVIVDVLKAKYKRIKK